MAKCVIWTLTTIVFLFIANVILVACNAPRIAQPFYWASCAGHAIVSLGGIAGTFVGNMYAQVCVWGDHLIHQLGPAFTQTLSDAYDFFGSPGRAIEEYCLHIATTIMSWQLPSYIPDVYTAFAGTILVIIGGIGGYVYFKYLFDWNDVNK